VLGSAVKRYAVSVERDASDRPAACTLDAPAFRLREDEFRGLFAGSLRAVEPIDARAARILLEGACEAELRDLLARELRCCSFFEFDVDAGEDVIALTARVPTGSESALAFLLELAVAAAA
jgi:hypothetical protein